MDWFLKLLPGSDMWSFLLTLPPLKQGMWLLLSSVKGREINLFQHELYFICAEVDFLSLKQRRDLWEGYWAITQLMGRLKNQAPEGEGRHDHRPATGTASVSCALWHRRRSVPRALPTSLKLL